MAKNKNLITCVKGDPSGSHVVAIERHGKIQVWDSQGSQRISRFDTILERVSRRLSISPDGRYIVVGAYSDRGVSLYSTNDGRELWNRPDLNQVQKVRFSSAGNYVVATFNEHQATFLSSTSGRSRRYSWLKKYFSRVEDIYESSFNSVFVHGQYDDDLLVTTREHLELVSIPRKTFAVLDHTFSAHQICVTESGGPISCYDIRSGIELWEFNPGDEVHGLCVEYIPSLNAYATVVWPYEDGGENTLYLLECQTGEKLMQYPVLNGGPAFIQTGAQMVFTDGAVVDTASGKQVNVLDFMAELAG